MPSTRAWQRRWRALRPYWTLWHLAQQRAKRAGLPFDITHDDVAAVWPADDRCPVLGLPLFGGTGGRPVDTSPTLDRLVPALGYVKGNIMVICRKANTIKSNATADEVAAVAHWMRQQGA